MKKIKIIIFLLVFLTSFNVYGITLGSSMGIKSGFINTRTKENNLNSKNKNSLFLGISYKYFWNINKIFVGVEGFYDFLNKKDSFLDEFNYRYGFNFNLGYDILNNFSIYTLFGSGFVKYTHGTKEKLKADLISGFGFSYDISQYWRINLEYTNQNLPIRKIENNIYKTRLQNLTVGISYKF